jgi:hypothetical protein
MWRLSSLLCLRRSSLTRVLALLDKKVKKIVNASVCRGVECLPEIVEPDALIAVL